MSKINNFKESFSNKAFIAYVTAGDPSLKATSKYIEALDRGGADIIEIGIPFSDPVAEGKVIAEASARALSRGITTDEIFNMCQDLKVRAKLVIMTYMNPVYVYGVEKFIGKCEEVGIKGIIIPDLPWEEKNEVAEVCKRYNVNLISLIAPNSKERIKKIAEDSEGFIYLVSSLGVTGVREKIKTNIEEIVKEIRRYSKLPIALGFGIGTPKQGKQMGKDVDGIIVGSAIVKKIAEGISEIELETFAKEMKKSLKI